jgi:hypothetical protein
MNSQNKKLQSGNINDLQKRFAPVEIKKKRLYAGAMNEEKIN